MNDCLFCAIIKGDIPSACIYEDEKVFVFKDIAPQAPVHFLAVPKEHIAGPADITEENSGYVAHVYEVIAKLAKELGLEKGFRVVANCGEDGGQTVGHLHFHVLAGRGLAWPPG